MNVIVIFAMKLSGTETKTINPLDRCSLAIYSSEWAAQTAMNYYKVDKSKVKVVPYGANIECHRDYDEIKKIINYRTSNKCKLLFLGVDWLRKGGDIAFKVAKELNKSGLETELTYVGCQPIIEEPLPEFVETPGFISKSTKEGMDKLNSLLNESHFLILPSRADCTPMVLNEANSFGLPCLTTNVGGMPTIIRDGLNGKMFSKDANISEYCTYISYLFSNYDQYKELAISSFNEYMTRLNWSVSGAKVKKLLMEIVG
jgi:glycosyltransferase involved in cell wall biosynthesis